MASVFTGGKFRVLDASGDPVSNAKIHTYEAATTTARATYTTRVGDVPNTNPVRTDSAGVCAIFLTPGVTRFVVTDANDVALPDGDFEVAAVAESGSLEASSGSASVGFIASGSGAVARTVQAKLRDFVSVMDFGAVGDGVADDAAAISAAFATRKAVFFPKPSAFYKITSALPVYYNARIYGEEGVTTIIRRTTGSGSVLDFLGSNENAVIEHLRIGGAGCTGVTVGGGGYVNYLSTLSMRNVHFENDLQRCMDVNLIHCNFVDCTFGYFYQTGAHASHQAIVGSFNVSNNVNINTLTNCKFFNGATTQDSVSITSGMVLTFNNCAWENNGRDLAVTNVQNVVLNNCYTERGKHAVSQFDFNQNRVRAKIIGGQFNGGVMPAGAAMFRADSDAKLLVEDADIVTTASAFTYVNASTGLNSLPTTGVHHFRNSRMQGNAADPLLYLEGVIEGAPVAFTPVPDGLTVVNGTGGATYSGTYSISNRVVTWTLKITTTGTCTTASSGGVTYFPFPSTLPVPAVSATGGATNEVTGGSLGVGLAYINGRFYPPGWTAQAGNIVMSGSFSI